MEHDSARSLPGTRIPTSLFSQTDIGRFFLPFVSRIALAYYFALAQDLRSRFRPQSGKPQILAAANKFLGRKTCGEDKVERSGEAVLATLLDRSMPARFAVHSRFMPDPFCK